MSFNLMDAASGLFTNELMGKASSFLGESQDGVTKAISGIVPSLLGGIAEKVSSGEGAGMVAKLANEANSSGILSNLNGFLGSESGSMLNTGASMLSGLFGGNKTNLLTNLISNFSGVKSSSAISLLSMALPAVMGLLGKHASSNNLDTAGLSSFLGSQKSSITKALPAGLDLSSIFDGFSTKTSETVKNVSHTTSHIVSETTENAGGGMKMLFPIILLLLAAAAAWYFFKDGCSSKTEEMVTSVNTEPVKNEVKEAIQTVTGKLDSLTGDFIYDLGENVMIDLPNNGGKLTVGKNSTEYRLVSFLNDKSAMLDTVKGNWFEFTNVRFNTGGSEITETSLNQLKNLVAISKAYPAAQFKIGGYTDNTGDAAANVTLSQKRAEAVVASLAKLGIQSAAIDKAKGYGQEWPIADNGTAEGRAQNRRVAVNVKAK